MDSDETKFLMLLLGSSLYPEEIQEVKEYFQDPSKYSKPDLVGSEYLECAVAHWLSLLTEPNRARTRYAHIQRYAAHAGRDYQGTQPTLQLATEGYV